MKTNYYLLVGLLLTIGCTENQRAKNYGFSETIELPPNCKFLNATWKEDDLWIIYKDTVSGLSYCKEKSSWGILEGQIIIKEATTH